MSKRKKVKYFGILRIPIPRPGATHASDKDYCRTKQKDEVQKIIRNDLE